MYISTRTNERMETDTPKSPMLIQVRQKGYGSDQIAVNQNSKIRTCIHFQIWTSLNCAIKNLKHMDISKLELVQKIRPLMPILYFSNLFSLSLEELHKACAEEHYVANGSAMCDAKKRLLTQPGVFGTDSHKVLSMRTIA